MSLHSFKRSAIAASAVPWEGFELNSSAGCVAATRLSMPAAAAAWAITLAAARFFAHSGGAASWLWSRSSAIASLPCSRARRNSGGCSCSNVSWHLAEFLSSALYSRSTLKTCAMSSTRRSSQFSRGWSCLRASLTAASASHHAALTSCSKALAAPSRSRFCERSRAAFALAMQFRDCFFSTALYLSNAASCEPNASRRCACSHSTPTCQSIAQSSRWSATVQPFSAPPVSSCWAPSDDEGSVLMELAICAAACKSENEAFSWSGLTRERLAHKRASTIPASARWLELPPLRRSDLISSLSASAGLPAS
mmetsp:Transcript_3523/g.7403  ORF Transcript_3523/g.7403 Transcript_3523/m.7403 type:complete len:309 (+) Transcript_3523:219-1145(+)